jgi:cytochrome c oxidase subunit 1
VVGHFHLTMAASVLLGAFAALYFWFPKMFGRELDAALGRWHFWLTIVPLTLVFCGMLVLGYAGMPRRLYDANTYEFLRRFQPLNASITWAAFVAGAAQLLFAANFLTSLFAGKTAAANPWQVGTLEWTVPSPPPEDNFETLPAVVRGPHELGHPATRRKDWLAQDEVSS